MSSLVKLSRVLPLAYPELFPQGPGNSAAPSPLAVAPDHVDATKEDAAAAIKAKRLKHLYQRSLRNQVHSDNLTYSGRLSA